MSDLTTAVPRLPLYSAPAVGPTSSTVAPAARSASSGPVSSRSSNSSSTSIATRLPDSGCIAGDSTACHNRWMNRLARERSPYLLQHANNPVDWYPWASEAFDKARAESKPIFLSIGYSTCHWCHVMEHESFENDDVARRAERALRVDQGRPRGAAGRRSRLHDVRAGDDRIRRLADERLAHARS